MVPFIRPLPLLGANRFDEGSDGNDNCDGEVEGEGDPVLNLIEGKGFIELIRFSRKASRLSVYSIMIMV